MDDKKKVPDYLEAPEILELLEEIQDIDKT
jgi:hypothetical protein